MAPVLAPDDTGARKTRIRPRSEALAGISALNKSLPEKREPEPKEKKVTLQAKVASEPSRRSMRQAAHQQAQAPQPTPGSHHSTTQADKPAADSLEVASSDQKEKDRSSQIAMRQLRARKLLANGGLRSHRDLRDNLPSGEYEEHVLRIIVQSELRPIADLRVLSETADIIHRDISTVNLIPAFERRDVLHLEAAYRDKAVLTWQSTCSSTLLSSKALAETLRNCSRTVFSIVQHTNNRVANGDSPPPFKDETMNDAVTLDAFAVILKVPS
ncbi:hypothetical protein GGX14DRAFT_576936 [Mycena pura]|uniref:Uncharacterized protein n=1 Tax=Mycena pura TaxID=153505 RepID=A0AAD6UT36_9AGAR|nr:hypothetical protein GGX14DRAFT_576936 [Mycena pura]